VLIACSTPVFFHNSLSLLCLPARREIKKALSLLYLSSAQDFSNQCPRLYYGAIKSIAPCLHMSALTAVFFSYNIFYHSIIPEAWVFVNFFASFVPSRLRRSGVRGMGGKRQSRFATHTPYPRARYGTQGPHAHFSARGHSGLTQTLPGCYLYNSMQSYCPTRALAALSLTPPRTFSPAIQPG
jgi:hypothetical protein